MQSDTGQEEWNEKFVHSASEIPHSAIRVFGQSQAGEKRADDRCHARIHGQGRQSEQQHQRHMKLGFIRLSLGMEMRQDMVDRGGSPLGQHDGECCGQASRQGNFQNIDVSCREAAHGRQNDQAEHVVNHRRGEDDLAGNFRQ